MKAPHADMFAIGMVLLDMAPADSLVNRRFVSNAGALTARAIASISERGDRVNIATVAMELKNSNSLQAVGGVTFLAAAVDLVIEDY